MNARTASAASLSVNRTEFVLLSDFVRFGNDSGYSALIKVGAGEFACFGQTFYFEDFLLFIERLRTAYRELAGSIELRPRFEDQWIRFEFTGRGHVVVSGFITRYSRFGCSLRFSFETDQTYLVPFIAQLEQVSAELHP